MQSSTPCFHPPKISVKGRFPFAMACPSFVYPAGYLENIQYLGPFVDEIELLFFESQPEAAPLPNPALIQGLKSLSDEHGLTFHLHLPTDIDPGHDDAVVRKQAIHALRELIRRTGPLSPTTFTLHLSPNPDTPSLSRWQAHAAESLKQVLDDRLPSRLISVENIDDQFNRVASPIIEALDLSVCVDTGHLMLYHMDVDAFFQRWRDRVTIIHLHSVVNEKDHQALDQLLPDPEKAILRLLKSFSGILSLEVFSLDALNRSMAWMMDHGAELNAKPS